MITMTLAQACRILDVDLDSIDSRFHQLLFTGITLDTRKLQPDNLFIVLKGAQVDGHDYLETAKQQGAVAALVSQASTVDLPLIRVKDVTDALGQLAAAWRDQFSLPIIGITGSNGKTTLKNMMHAILIAACQNDRNQVLATLGNLNNHWGLPLTLARLNVEHRYAIIEMGMNHFGEIEYLTQLAKPSIAIITNAAACHIEGVGDIAGVARAKAEIFMGLAPDGIAILNRDDAFYSYWREQIQHHSYLTFGWHEEAHVRGEIVENTSADNTQTSLINLQTPIGNIEINLPLLGKHNVLNALAATAAALALDIDLATIKRGLEEHLQSAPGRLQLHILANGVKIIDDTYNANPFSLQAAVDTLVTFQGKKILVLGDMKELGPEAKPLHFTAGEKIRAAGIDYLFTLGELSAQSANAFGDGAYHFNEQDKLINALKPFLYNQTTILIKGSRSMRMEKIVAELVQ